MQTNSCTKFRQGGELYSFGRFVRRTIYVLLISALVWPPLLLHLASLVSLILPALRVFHLRSHLSAPLLQEKMDRTATVTTFISNDATPDIPFGLGVVRDIKHVSSRISRIDGVNGAKNASRSPFKPWRRRHSKHPQRTSAKFSFLRIFLWSTRKRMLYVTDHLTPVPLRPELSFWAQCYRTHGT